MTIKEFSRQLNTILPLKQAEDFDNVGLLCGHPDAEITGILVCHDALENIVEEAINKGFNLIITFHPIIFSGLKSITGKNYVERAVLKAIENRIAIFAIHTALDNDSLGVNYRICEELGLIQQQVLMPKTNFLNKLDVYVPAAYEEKVKEALFTSGAGSIGYD